MKLRILVVFVTACIAFNAIFAGSPADLFPKIDHWKLKVEKTVYTPDNLWELINGAADAFLSYDFQDLTIGEYSRGENDIVRVEIYHHSSNDNAFGIYSAEKMPDYNFLKIGVQGYDTEGSLNFVTGPYYIKIMLSGPGNVSREEIKNIADKVEDYLGQKDNWPKELSFFPDERKLIHTENYIAENFLGYSFFNKAFTVDYEIDNTTFKLFLIHLDTPTEIQKQLKKYFDLVKFKTDQIEDKQYFLEDPFNGKICIGVKNEYMYGIFNLENEEIMKELAGQMEKSIPVKDTIK